MSENPPEKSGSEPLDFQRMKMVLELEKELEGLFGIDRRDIEGALDRLFAGEISIADRTGSNLPESVQVAIRCLDALEAVARRCLEDERKEEFESILELMDHYRKKISASREDRI